MCDPIMALTGVTVANGIFSYQASKEQARAQEAVGRNNAKIAEYKIKDAVYRGEMRDKRHRQAVADTVSNQRVAFASKGFEVNSGSALETVLDTVGQGEIDAMVIRGDIGREVWGNEVQGQSMSTQAEMDAAFTRANGYSSLLSSGIQAASYHIPRGK